MLFDLKSGELNHQDIGQMNMYVRMMDDLKRTPDDNPTVGIILCTQKDASVVRYSVLHENEQMFASRYKLVLPSEEELRKEWSKRSQVDYDNGVDLKGNPIRNILWRYMTSKGLKKDSLDFQKMTKEDIRNVERGFASVEMAKGGISAQIYRMRGQLNDAENPNGKSLLEKIESLKAGITIIKAHPIIGVGVGDLKASFAQAYRSNHSKLTIENQHLTHNQYLTTWIAGGIFCFIAFISLWFIQFATALKINAFEWTGFLVITLLSYLIEDTLQTQTGVTLVAFFFAFFITGRKILYPWK